MMASEYDIELDQNYINNCTYEKKAGMYPTFDIINEFLFQSGQPDLMPTQQTSPIIDMFVTELNITPATITNYFKSMYGYRNSMLPLSKRYPNLRTISNRLRTLWYNHDQTNKLKFERLVTVITDMSNISPLFNKHIKSSSEGVTTPNLTDTTSINDTQRNQTTVTDTYNSTDTHGGQDVKTTQNTDQSNTSTVNGVTSFDQSANFVNNDNSITTDSTAGDETETKSFGETLAHTGSDTHGTNGTLTNQGTHTTQKRGTSTQTNDGDTWVSDLSLSQAQIRESTIESILISYFNSVLHDIALYTLEEIW